jgi:hypothetical protein
MPSCGQPLYGDTQTTTISTIFNQPYNELYKTIALLVQSIPQPFEADCAKTRSTIGELFSYSLWINQLFINMAVFFVYTF